MAYKHFVAKKVDLEKSQKILVHTDTRSIVVVLHGGVIYAFDNLCTHADGPLNEGVVSDPCHIECNWHGAKFDMKTGKVVEGPAQEDIETYTVIEEGDSVFLQLED